MVRASFKPLLPSLGNSSNYFKSTLRESLSISYLEYCNDGFPVPYVARRG